jgi:hypothetical protein
MSPESHNYTTFCSHPIALLSNQLSLLPNTKMDSTLDSTSSSLQFYQCKYGRVRLLAVDNYPDWSTTLSNFLKADHTWKIVQGIEKPPQDEAEIKVAQEAYEEKQEDYESRSAKACSNLRYDRPKRKRADVFGGLIG